MKSLTRMHISPRPGEILAGTVLRDDGGMTFKQFAKHLKVSRVALSRVVNGRAAVSAELAIRLAAALGGSGERKLDTQQFLGETPSYSPSPTDRQWHMQRLDWPRMHRTEARRFAVEIGGCPGLLIRRGGRGVSPLKSVDVRVTALRQRGSHCSGSLPTGTRAELVAANRLFLKEIESAITDGADFASETTLAGRRHLPLIHRLRSSGCRIELIYLALPAVEMSRQRVAERVAHGGHGIPDADIVRRFPRSLHNLLHVFATEVDRVLDEYGYATRADICAIRCTPARARRCLGVFSAGAREQ